MAATRGRDARRRRALVDVSGLARAGPRDSDHPARSARRHPRCGSGRHHGRGRRDGGGRARSDLQSAVRVAGEDDQPRAAGVAGRRSRLRHPPGDCARRRRRRQQPRAARRDDVGDGLRRAGCGRDRVGHPLLGGRADRLRRHGSSGGTRAHGGRGAVHRPVAVAVPPRCGSRQRGRFGAAGQRQRARRHGHG